MPIPFGWYVVDYADELKAGEVKSVRYFGQDQVLFQQPRVKSVCLMPTALI